jgi:signal transduction histidine kinase
VTNVSHELRTPITAIKGSVDVVLGQMTGDLNQQQEMFMMMARKNCDRLQILIDDILEVSQIDAGQMNLELEKLAIGAILSDVVQEYEGRVRRENRNIDVDLNLPALLSPVQGDAQRVRQIVSNLVSNAFQYTEDGGRVGIRASQRGNFVQVDVTDTGIGIPPEAAARVFERFYRGEDELVMASAGPGLGLWITKTLVEMHGGEIWFASSGVPGEGSTFSFTLPVQREDVVHV